MKKIFYIFITMSLSFASLAYAAKTTVLLYGSAGGQFCTDENGLQTGTDGTVYAMGVTAGVCPPPTNPPPPPFNQQTTASIFYRPAGGTRPNADVTLWKNIVGRINATNPVVEWPYISGSTPSFTLLANRVIAAKMIVPVNANTVAHPIKNVSYFSSGGLTISVSTVPGDFNPSQAACVKHNAPNNDAPMIYVRAGGTPNRSICSLNPGETYYVNLKFENPAQGGLLTLLWY